MKNDLVPGQFCVVFAEVATGIVLDLDGQRYRQVGESRVVFDSLESAEAFARKRVEEQPEIEAWIEDATGGHMRLIRASEVGGVGPHFGDPGKGPV